VFAGPDIQQTHRHPQATGYLRGWMSLFDDLLNCFCFELRRKLGSFHDHSLDSLVTILTVYRIGGMPHKHFQEYFDYETS
jgi:hypothetical protein